MRSLKRKILIAAATERACTLLRELTGDDCMIVTATDGSTLRCIGLGGFDYIVVSLPLANESGIELIDDLREKTDVPFIVIVKQGLAETVYEKVLHTGVYMLERPLGKGSIMQAIHFIEMHAANEAELRKQLNEEREKNEEQRAVYRAKLILIEKGGMSEADAHKYIQQRAMNDRRSLMTTAEIIISEYEKKV